MSTFKSLNLLLFSLLIHIRAISAQAALVTTTETETAATITELARTVTEPAATVIVSAWTITKTGTTITESARTIIDTAETTTYPARTLTEPAQTATLVRPTIDWSIVVDTYRGPYTEIVVVGVANSIIESDLAAYRGSLSTAYQYWEGVYDSAQPTTAISFDQSWTTALPSGYFSFVNSVRLEQKSIILSDAGTAATLIPISLPTDVTPSITSSGSTAAAPSATPSSTIVTAGATRPGAGLWLAGLGLGTGFAAAMVV